MRLEIQCEDRIGMVHEVLKLFALYEMDMRLIEVDTTNRCLYVGFPDIEFASLQRILATIRRLGGVEDVKLVSFSSSEREKNTLSQVLNALPDGVIAIDLKGNVTMITELAAKDLGVDTHELLHKPLNSVIKSVNFARLSYSDIKDGISKRIRVNRKSLLMDVQPIRMTGNGGEVYAGAVIHLKSESRIDRQSERVRRDHGELKLEEYFQSNMVQSESMKACLMQAKRYAMLDSPLMIAGEAGSGKDTILNSLIEYWQSNGYQDVNIHRKKAIELQSEQDMEAFLTHSGWLVIDGVEGLSEVVQVHLDLWLKRSQSQFIDDRSFRRLVVFTSSTLEDFQRSNHFAFELYLQLAQQNILVPALRDRIEDIDGLSEALLKMVCEHLRVPEVELSKNAILKLKLYSWPGNISELKGVLYSAVSSTQRTELRADDLRLPKETSGVELELVDGSLDKTLKTWEAALLRELYPKYPSTRKLANALGVSHSAIANKLRDYAIGK